MTPEEKAQFEELKIEVAQLRMSIEQSRVQQISLPLDPASVQVIARALQDAGYVIT